MLVVCVQASPCFLALLIKGKSDAIALLNPHVGFPPKPTAKCLQIPLKYYIHKAFQYYEELIT
jgi:hypothetical protein